MYLGRSSRLFGLSRLFSLSGLFSLFSWTWVKNEVRKFKGLELCLPAGASAQAGGLSIKVSGLDYVAPRGRGLADLSI